MAEIEWNIYTMYYTKVLPLDPSPDSPYYKDVIHTLRWDTDQQDLEAQGYTFERTAEQRWAFNTNNDAHSEQHFPFGQYEYKRVKDFRIGQANRATIVAFRKYNGEILGLPIENSSQVYDLTKLLQSRDIKERMKNSRDIRKIS